MTTKSKVRKIAVRESREFLVVFVFLTPFFLAFATYRMYLKDGFTNAFFNYGAAVVNALVLSKVILIGEALGLGRRLESKPLIVPTFYKAGVFTVFSSAFHLLEEVVRALFHGQSLAHAVRAGAVTEETLSRSLIVFLAFIPFFGLRETERILGIESFRLFFHPRGPSCTERIEQSQQDSAA